MSRIGAAGILGVLTLFFGWSYHLSALTHEATPLPSPEVEAVYQAAPVASSTPGSVRVPIFVYHSVRPDFPGERKDQEAFSVTPEEFEAQLKYLSDNGYTAITLDELAHDTQTGTTSPAAKPVVLTFDDGSQNQFDYAFPLLKKYHMVAVFFIYPHPISLSPNFMTWAEVKELSDAGMVIGDHTMTHPLLSKLDKAGLEHETIDSKKILEAHIGKPVTDFASPFGYTSPLVVSVLKEAGYTTGRTLYKGAWHSPQSLLTLTGFLVHHDLNDFIWVLKYSK